MIGQPLGRFGEDAVIENHRSMGATRPGLADRIDKRQL